MKIISWNVNGVRSIHGKGFADFISSERPEIVCIQETKAHLEQLSPKERELVDYNLVMSSAIQRGYSGVGNYFHQKRCPEPKRILKGIGKDVFDSEGRFLITDLDSILLYNIYFPSGTTGEIRQKYKYEFLDALLEHLEQLPKKDLKRTVICGDFNICHKPNDIHHPEVAEKRNLSGYLLEERQWMDRFTAAGFIDCYREINGEAKRDYTWWTFRANARAKNLGWRIDYFFVAKDLQKKLSQAKIHSSILGSDHCPISIEIDV